MTRRHHTASPRRRRLGAAATTVLLLGSLVAGALVTAPPATPPAAADTTVTVPMMGPPVLSAAQLAAWFRSTGRAFNVPGETPESLASYFVDEGVGVNIRGDLAFAQSIVETGYFGFVGSMVKPTDYNFAGMGACDTCSSGRPFPNARTGVRAQVQHLRNYADISSRAANLPTPPVVEWYGRRVVNGVVTYDPALAIYNFDTFFAKGRAPTWNQMGNGNWATATNYFTTVVGVYEKILTWNGIPTIAKAGADPAGRTDLVERVPGGVHIGGWAFDISTPDAINVRITLNGTPIATVVANGYRPDVDAVFRWGPNHGFDAVVGVNTGGTVCAFGVNVGVGSRDTPLGCGTIPGPDPVGALDSISRAPGGVRVTGWGLDPDTAGAATILVTKDGALGAAIPAGSPRADIGAAYPPYGANHGFDAVVPVAGGSVCVYVVNVGPGTPVRLLGCQNLIGPAPLSAIESVTRVPGGVRVVGWAVDPDAADPVPVHVYAGGVGVAILADKVRPNFSQYFPGYGDAHGFDATVALPGGQTCLYAINVGFGSTNPLMGCSTLLGPVPVGTVDSATRVPAGVRLRGWALDGDTAGPVDVHIYANGRFVAATTANTNRPDLGTFFPAWGPNHGYEVTVPVTATGPVQYCAYAINAGFGGLNPLIGCRTVTVGSQPFGILESVARVAGGFRITGWVIDPDSTDPVSLHVYVDGTFRGVLTANGSRPDVGAIFAGYGDLHGVDGTVAASGGQVCVYAINIGGGVHPLLGCRTL
ncbi:MAG: glucosaminidase domain-containing protein [Actinomycetes bacterium]